MKGQVEATLPLAERGTQPFHCIADVHEEVHLMGETHDEAHVTEIPGCTSPSRTTCDGKSVSWNDVVDIHFGGQAPRHLHRIVMTHDALSTWTDKPWKLQHESQAGDESSFLAHMPNIRCDIMIYQHMMITAI